MMCVNMVGLPKSKPKNVEQKIVAAQWDN